MGKSVRQAGCSSIGRPSGAIVICSASRTGEYRFAEVVPVSPSRPGVSMRTSSDRPRIVVTAVGAHLGSA